MLSGEGPGEGLAPGTPVELIDFEIGVMERKNREGAVTGVQVWYRAGLAPPDRGHRPAASPRPPEAVA